MAKPISSRPLAAIMPSKTGDDGKSHVPSVWPVPLSASIKRRPEYLDYLQLESTSTMEDNLGSLQKTVVFAADAVIPVNSLNKEQ